MRTQVITFVQPAKELKKGDRILLNSHAVVEINNVQQFVTLSDQRMVEVELAPTSKWDYKNLIMESIIMFSADDLILTIE